LAHVPINALSGIIPHYALQICCNFVAKSESKYRKPLKILALFVQRLHRRERQSSYFIILHNRLSPLFSNNSTLHYDVLFYQ